MNDERGPLRAEIASVRGLGVAATLLLVVLAGCRSAPSRDGTATEGGGREPSAESVAPEVRDPGVEPDGTRMERTGSRSVTVLGGSVEGRPIEAWVIGDGDPCVMILATIHGDEWAGTPLLEELAVELEGQAAAGALDRCVVLVPIANPDGYAARDRESSTGIDLNRNFPSSNFSASRGL